jgi:GT2 family glycosyltransferase
MPNPEKDRANQGVTLVVPTLNRGEYLVDTLHDLLAQDYRPLEILVVDQSSDDAPELSELVSRKTETLAYHKVRFRGLPMARNFGWQQARYDTLVFVDDDIRCGPTLVSEHVRGLSLPNVGMVAGGIDEGNPPQSDGELPGRFNSWTATAVRSFGTNQECFVQHVAGCNFSARRSVLQAAGGFDEALAVGAALYEETELCLRVQKCGFDIYFNGNARLQHLVAGNGGCRVPDPAKYMESLAHNRVILIERHVRWFQAPVAYARLFVLFLSYAAHYRSLALVRAGMKGMSAGLRDAKQPPRCSDFGSGVRA